MTAQASGIWFEPMKIVKSGAVEITVKDEVKAPSADVHPNQTGEDLRQLQYALVKVGYLKDAPADGKWTAATYSALCKFQDDWFLGVDGDYGSGSRTALEKALKGDKPPDATPPVPPTDPPDDRDSSLDEMEYRGNPNRVMGDAKDVSGTVYWVKSRKGQEKPEFWLSRKQANLDHWKEKKKDGTVVNDYFNCADFRDTTEQYGPKCEFSVPRVGIMHGCGGFVDLKLTNGQLIRLLHFWTLNIDLHEAQQNGTKLPAGTYLGSTARHIGFTTGPHLHAENPSGTHRDTWIGWMHGEFGS